MLWVERRFPGLIGSADIRDFRGGDRELEARLDDRSRPDLGS